MEQDYLDDSMQPKGAYTMRVVRGVDKSWKNARSKGLRGIYEKIFWNREIKKRERIDGSAVAAFLQSWGGKEVDSWTTPNRFVDQGLNMITSRLGNISAQVVPIYLQLGTSATAWARSQTGCQTPITTGGLEFGAGTLSIQTTDVTNDTYRVVKTFTASAAFTAGNGPKEAAIFNNSGAALDKCLCRTTYSERTLAISDQLIVTYNMKLVP
jgi:hypothetical protein